MACGIFHFHSIFQTLSSVLPPTSGINPDQKQKAERLGSSWGSLSPEEWQEYVADELAILF